MQRPEGDWRAFSQNLVIHTFLRLALCLPYKARVRLVGWMVSRIVAPIAGWNKRIAWNLNHVLPDLPPDEVRRLQRKVPENAGRTLMEIYSGQEFSDRVRGTPLSGPGVAAFTEAREAGRPVVLVTGHFGNYDAPRAALFAQGYPLAALYRNMRNQQFNDHYVSAISKIGEPVFPANRKGITQLVRHLADGGIMGILVDVFAVGGAKLKYFGKPARTALSAAEWALKYDALMVPIYGIRQPDGFSFKVHLDAPIPHTDAMEMTQALNDSLEQHTRAHLDQWFWIHRRWKKDMGPKADAQPR